MKQDSVFHGVELLLNYYLSLFMTKKFFAGSMLALLACVSLASCTTGGGEEVQYVKIGQNLCSFLAEGNQPLEIDVKASPAEWTVEAGATWVKAERTADRTLTVTVEDNDTGSERSAVLTVTAGQAVQEIGIRQLAADGAFARFRKLDTFSMGAAMSPSGRYAGGFVISIAPDDSYQNFGIFVLLYRPQIEDGSVPFRQGVHARLYLSRRKFVEDRRRYGAAEVRRAHFIGSLQRVPAAEIGHDRIDEYPSAPTLERSVAAVVAYARIERHETVVQQVFRRGSVAHIAPYDAIHRTAVAYVQFAASLRVPPAATLYYLFQCQRRSVIR